MPLVPLASSGGRGRLTHTSQPRHQLAGQRHVVVLEEGDAPGDARARACSVNSLAHQLLGRRRRAGGPCRRTRTAPGARRRAAPSARSGIMRQQVQALVGGQAAREADGQPVGVEAAAGGLGVVERLAAAQPVADGAVARSCRPAARALRAARGPQLGGRDVVPPAPRSPGRSARASQPAPEMAVEQRRASGRAARWARARRW